MNQYKNGIKFRELLIPCFNSRRTHIYLNINSVSEGLYISYHRHFGQQLDIHIRYMSTLHSPHLSYLACSRYIAPKRFVFDEVHQEKSIRHSPPCGATHIKEHMIEVIVVMLCYDYTLNINIEIKEVCNQNREYCIYSPNCIRGFVTLCSGTSCRCDTFNLIYEYAQEALGIICQLRYMIKKLHHLHLQLD